MTIHYAVKDIVHARPLCEVIDALLFEARCPICGDKSYYVGISGPSCPESGCVNYHKAASQSWQLLVKDSLTRPKDKVKARRALEAMEQSDVKLPIIANSGLDKLLIYAFIRDRSRYDKIHPFVNQVVRQLKKNMDVKNPKDKLFNTRTRHYFGFERVWKANPIPTINNPDVEKWYKSLRSEAVVRLELGQNYVLNFIWENIDFYEHVSPSNVANDVAHFARMVGERIRRYYNTVFIPKLKGTGASKSHKHATTKKAISGTLIHGRWQNWLDTGDIVPGWGVPPVQGFQGLGNLDRTTAYEILVHQSGNSPTNRWTKMKDLRTGRIVYVLVDEKDLWDVYAGRPSISSILPKKP